LGISILLARALIDGLGEAGVAQDRFLAAARFDPSRIDDADGRMSAEEYDALVECALDLTADESFGLRFGERTSPAAHQLLAHLLMSAGTLREGMDGLLRFQSLLIDGPGCRLEEHDRDACIVYEVAPGSARCRRFRAELAMTGFSRIVEYFGRGARPREVAFEYPAPVYRSQYARVFGGAERFDQSFTGIVIARDLLAAVPLHGDTEFHRALEVQAEARVARLGRAKSYAERVREYLLDGGANRGDDMAGVARGLGISVRTLRRRLQGESATYGAIASEAFVVLAKRLLVDEARSVEETAYAMGYATPTSFHRAFKRWARTTPKAFRQSHDRPSRP
jgi:AraC-like DNA-binding protein